MPNRPAVLPDLPGWDATLAEPPSAGDKPALWRAYTKGRTRLVVSATGGPHAASVVASQSLVPDHEDTKGPWPSRRWMLEGCKAFLMQSRRGALHTLDIILRGGPGDLPGSVHLSITGQHARAHDALELALALDWDAIRAALDGGHPMDHARIAAATAPPRPAPAGRLRLWPMTPALGVMQRVGKLERKRPPGFEFVNRHLVFNAPGMQDLGEPDHPSLHALARPPGPAPHLRITARAFAPDFLFAGCHFVSARMRDALALAPDEAEYGPVDSSGSSKAAVAAEYRTLHALHWADPLDYAATFGHEPDRDDHGAPTMAWLHAQGGPHAPPRARVWREDFVPPAPLFRYGYGDLMATDALAERVMRAGFTDLAFQDVSSEAARHGLAFRTI